MTDLSPELIRQVAQLARLDLDEQDISRYQKHMGEILNYVERLQQLQSDETPELDSDEDKLVVPCERPDECQESLAIEDILANAPRKVGTSFQVPKIIE